MTSKEEEEEAILLMKVTTPLLKATMILIKRLLPKLNLKPLP